jgi:hypothetical protein
VIIPPDAKRVELGYNPGDDLWPLTLLAASKSFLTIADGAVAQLGPLEASSPHYLTL